MWPAVWPGTSMTSKRRPRTSTVSPCARRTRGSGADSRARPSTPAPPPLPEASPPAALLGRGGRDKKGLQRRAQAAQGIRHGRGLTRVDDDGPVAVVQHPQVIVGKGGQRYQIHNHSDYKF